MMDMFEGQSIADPTRRVLGRLCDQARSRVLSTSLSHAIVEDEFAKILFAAWFTDLDYKRGTKLFLEEIKQMPRAEFLRFTLAMHCLSRSNWTQWLRQERLGILDIAEELLKPLPRSINKGKLKREIEKGSKD